VRLSHPQDSPKAAPAIVSRRVARARFLFFEELLGVFAPFRSRDFVFLNRSPESLAQSVKVNSPQLFVPISRRPSPLK